MREKLTKTRYAGVYTKTLKHDVSFVVRFLHDKKVIDKVAGKRSQGMNAKKALFFKHELESAKKEELFKELNNKFISTSFKEVANKYIEVNAKRWSKGSLKGFVVIAKRLETYFENYKLLDITPLDIQNFIAIYLKDKSPYTFNAYLGVISAIFRLAKDFYGVENNAYLTIKKHKVSKSRLRYLSLSETRILKRYILDSKNLHAKDLYLFVCLSLSTGGRLKTILTIKKEDINLEEESITLFNYKVNRHYKGYLDAKCLRLLKKHIKTLSQKDLIFKMSYQTCQINLSKMLNLLFNQDLKDPNDKVVIHTLRHTFASWLAIKGVPLQVIQVGLDHSSISMTMRYAHLSPSSTKRFVLKALNG
ncbi:site-specific integrase [Helicobacter sp. 11S02629-2]|uniref:tyrosine-type recombinase/integrase n=1 Tax=Helicobacter sp. 11S02629-2 TaxID=1476195 RepID=UPI000BC7B310|nr:site-specific integrase [Helicobacter sp. 11S02629-2]PAF41951.1 hypothetical protein BKH40_08225 [Helicobacter sp. 11S02629-2]